MMVRKMFFKILRFAQNDIWENVQNGRVRKRKEKDSSSLALLRMTMRGMLLRMTGWDARNGMERERA